MLTPKQCRFFDEFLIDEVGIPGAILMENAGRNCAELILRVQNKLDPTSVVRATILCGAGNNGGDGFVIARHLANAGGEAKVIVFSDLPAYSGDAKTMLDCLQPLSIQAIQYSPTDGQTANARDIANIDDKPVNWIVDALLGTGAKGPLRSEMAGAVSIANELPVRRFAVDVPSGLDPTTGIPNRVTFIADHCGTFVDSKSGFANPLATPYLGLTVVMDIGFTPDSCSWIPPEK
jgi:NAD(P)H-hydrate epimerase